MPVYTTSPNGFKLSFPSPKTEKQAIALKTFAGTKRGVCKGWTPDSSRRNADALRAIDIEAMNLAAIYGVTLTMRNAPPSPEDYKTRLDTLFKRLSREGFTLRHYVTEWAQVGRFGGSPVPHLHLTLFDDAGIITGRDGWGVDMTILCHWRDVFGDLGVTFQAQHVAQVDQFLGWAAYAAKHSARASSHVQRSEETLPDGWDRPGRMWGMSRGIPKRADLIDLPHSAAYEFRRLVLRYLLSVERNRMRKATCDKRRQQIKRRQIYLKKMLQRPRENSERLPVSEFLTENIHQMLLETAFQTFYDKPT